MSNTPSKERVFNFNAGPAVLPLEAVEEIREGFMNFGGMSVLEISHRGKEFKAVLDETTALVRELMGVPEGYHVLFMQGGASQQFAMVPMNLMDKGADYVSTGTWAKKAISEAKFFGSPATVYSSQETKFNRCPRPDEVKATPGASYLHVTSNNTIEGTQYRAFPDAGSVPLVADMSSDILSCPVDVSRFGMIYAGAQKNVGPAGVTIVVIRDDLAKKSCREIPAIFRYSTHAENASLYNTPPVFPIYATMMTLRWLKKQGGVKAMAKRNGEKAKLIYDALDASSFYKSPVERESRSLMNIVFTLPSDELTEKFVAGAKERGMVGLKGHRSVGGIRSSVYNAFPIEGARALVDYMKEFERTAP
ncbi:MAG TPA: 3-phosphoserine/phosphohydroxythreonine transaminase [bacterium]|nr:3-phosphoserine/phosphohydroxythreonine transaminase [bacterium]